MSVCTKTHDCKRFEQIGWGAIETNAKEENSRNELDETLGTIT